MITRILCGLFVGVMSFNAFSAEVFFCYEKLECPKDNDFYACKRVGEKTGVWTSATPVIIGSLKKGTYNLQNAYYYDRSIFPGSCDYGSVVLSTKERVHAYSLPESLSRWEVRRYPDYICNSSNPKECAFINYG